MTDAPYDAGDAPTGQAYTATPSTEDDVELVARALWEQCDAPSDGPTSVCYEDARAALSALAAAGRLRHPDGWWETPPPLSDGRRLRRWVEPWQPAPTESEDR